MSDEQRSPGSASRLEAPPQSRFGLFNLSMLLLIALVVANMWLIHQGLDREQRNRLEHCFWQVCQPGATTEARTQAMLQLVAAGNREWRSANLARVKLSELNLRNAYLHYADLSSSDFSKTDLTGSILTKCDFQMANLTEIKASDADFTESNLYRTKLNNSDLRKAKFHAARLQEAKLMSSDLMLAQLSEANLLMADLTGADLAGANLTEANLTAATFKNANLALARLSAAKIKDTDFTNCNWWRARGLAVQEIVRLKNKYAPTTDADPKLREDFKTWLASITSSRGSNTNSP